MTIFELHLAFEDALDKLSSSSYPEIPLEQRDRLLNLGAERFIKQRYGGTNPKFKGFEQIQKRTDDLSNLVQYARLPVLEDGFYNVPGAIRTVFYQVPADYWFSLTERVNLFEPNCGNFNVDVRIARHNDINHRIRDPYNKPKRTRVFRVMASVDNINANLLQNPLQANTSLIQLFYDPIVTPGDYELSYLKQFIKLRAQTVLNQQPDGGIPFTYQIFDAAQPNFWRTTQYWFNTEAHQEIVDLAVKATMEVIEHPRYGTFQNEVNVQE